MTTWISLTEVKHVIILCMILQGSNKVFITWGAILLEPFCNTPPYSFQYLIYRGWHSTSIISFTLLWQVSSFLPTATMWLVWMDVKILVFGDVVTNVCKYFKQQLTKNIPLFEDCSVFYTLTKLLITNSWFEKSWSNQMKF